MDVEARPDPSVLIFAFLPRSVYTARFIIELIPLRPPIEPLSRQGIVKHLRIAFVSFVLFACAGQKTSDSDQIVLGVVRGLLNLSDTYVISADGTGKTTERLPWGLGGQAEWSPDGQWIVFSTLHAMGKLENAVIYLMRSDGSQRHHIVEHPGGSFGPTWAPDGTRIAYYAYKEGNIYQLDVECFLRDEECDSEPILLAPGRSPDWSPDGKQIVYESEMPLGAILAIYDDGSGEPVNLTKQLKNCFEPQWSPDGSRLVFRCEDGIYVSRADGSDPVKIETGIGSVQPRWSPDGSKIAFVSMRDGLGQMIGLDDTNRSTAIFLMNADGTDVIRLRPRDDETVLWYAWLPPATLSINP